MRKVVSRFWLPIHPGLPVSTARYRGVSVELDDEFIEGECLEDVFRRCYFHPLRAVPHLRSKPSGREREVLGDDLLEPWDVPILDRLHDPSFEFFNLGGSICHRLKYVLVIKRI